ncbi:MAG: S8 family serine peptidase [Eubacteriales bacterium]|nr:S8 family serine peptidase [Eubacteriales bacterium]
MKKKIITWLLCLILLLLTGIESVCASVWYMDGAVSATDSSQMELSKAWKYADGRGVNVALIDGGANLNDPAIKPRVKGVYNADTGSTSWNSVQNASASHGTSCAKILLGVAPKVNLYVIKAGGNGSIYSEQVIKGLKWAKSKKCRVISMSFGGSSYDQAEYNAINELFTGANSALVCASGGNSGKHEYHYSASYTNTLSVGAAKYNSSKKQYVVIPKATYNDKMDVVAPGGTTSAAAPFAAGTAALLFQVKPSMTASQCRDILRSTAKDLGAKGKDDYYGYGLIQPYKAVLKAAGKTGSSGSKISLTKTSLTLTAGKTAQLTYKNGSNVKWISNKTSVATVNSKGKVTAVSSGNAVITAKSSNGTKASCKIAVKPSSVKGAILTNRGGSKQLLVTWRRDSKVTGYQVQIATNSTFTQNSRTFSTTDNKTTYFSFKNLQTGRRYYMRIRAYKMIDSKTFYWGAWAKTSGTVKVL